MSRRNRMPVGHLAKVLPFQPAPLSLDVSPAIGEISMLKCRVCHRRMIASLESKCECGACAWHPVAV